MASETIITATFGVPGSGKTYSRVKFLVDDFLLNNPSGMYITNIPLNVSKIAEYVSSVLTKKGAAVSPESVASRIHIIPEEVLIDWEKLNSLDNKDLNLFDSSTFPPSKYLSSLSLEGSHIALDEFHKYFSKRGPKPLKKLWNDWFAEIRKTGCVFEAITQSYGQMADEFLDKVGTRLELINHSDLRDPFFGIKMGDWYELKAGLLGKLSLQRITERETMRSCSDSGKIAWKFTGKHQSYLLESFYFQFYNSFHNSTGTSGVRKTPSEIYGRKIVFWFLRRNIFSVLPRVLIFCFVVWFLLFGGVQFAIGTVFDMLRFGSSNSFASNSVSATKSGSAALSGDANSGSVTKSGSATKPADANSGSVPKPDPPPDFSGFRPVLFYRNFVFLASGEKVSVGYVFKGKLKNGCKVVQVSFADRYYVLSDGSVFRMFGN